MSIILVALGVPMSSTTARPVHPYELILGVARALKHKALREEVQALRSSLDQKYGFDSIIGHSHVLLYVLDITASMVYRNHETGLAIAEAATTLIGFLTPSWLPSRADPQSLLERGREVRLPHEVEVHAPGGGAPLGDGPDD